VTLIECTHPTLSTTGRSRPPHRHRCGSRTPSCPRPCESDLRPCRAVPPREEDSSARGRGLAMSQTTTPDCVAGHRDDAPVRQDKGFVSFGTAELRTEQYAIVGALRGDGHSWIYGSTVLGDERVRATAQAETPLFIGIARRHRQRRSTSGAATWSRRSRTWSTRATFAGSSSRTPTTRPSARCRETVS
jgi:hypothetical protein